MQPEGTAAAGGGPVEVLWQYTALLLCAHTRQCMHIQYAYTNTQVYCIVLYLSNMPTHGNICKHTHTHTHRHSLAKKPRTPGSLTRRGRTSGVGRPIMVCCRVPVQQQYKAMRCPCGSHVLQVGKVVIMSSTLFSMVFCSCCILACKKGTDGAKLS